MVYFPRSSPETETLVLRFMHSLIPFSSGFNSCSRTMHLVTGFGLVDCSFRREALNDAGRCLKLEWKHHSIYLRFCEDLCPVQALLMCIIQSNHPNMCAHRCMKHLPAHHLAASTLVALRYCAQSKLPLSFQHKEYLLCLLDHSLPPGDQLLEVCPPEKECRPNVGWTPGPLMRISLHDSQTLETPRVFLTPPAISHAQLRLPTCHEYPGEVRARFACNEP